MQGRRRIVWLALVCLLLVILLGAVESGKLSGVRNLGGPGRPYPIGGGPLLTSPGSNSTWQLWRTNSTEALQPSAIPGAQLLGAPEIQPLSIQWWYILVPVLLGVLAALALLIRRVSRPKVYDFKGALEELDRQRSRINASLTGAMRNEVLIRYYALMRKVLGRIGLQDEPAETPSEYLERVAGELKMNPDQATEFAEVFNRARYGLELTAEEVSDASTFMGGFLDGIRRRVGIG